MPLAVSFVAPQLTWIQGRKKHIKTISAAVVVARLLSMKHCDQVEHWSNSWPKWFHLLNLFICIRIESKHWLKCRVPIAPTATKTYNDLLRQVARLAASLRVFCLPIRLRFNFERAKCIPIGWYCFCDSSNRELRGVMKLLRFTITLFVIALILALAAVSVAHLR